MSLWHDPDNLPSNMVKVDCNKCDKYKRTEETQKVLVGKFRGNKIYKEFPIWKCLDSKICCWEKETNNVGSM